MVRAFIGLMAAVVLLAGGAFIAEGYLNSRRSMHKVVERRRAVQAMSLQELSAAIARCDGAQPAPRDAGLCEEVARELDRRPLEIVDVDKPAKPPPGPRR